MKTLSKPFTIAFITAMVLFAATRAQALSTTFTIYFDETVGTGSHWQGTYTITDGTLTAFSAQIGNCLAATNCLYNILTRDDANPGEFSADPSALGRVLAPFSNRLFYIPSEHTWDAVNVFDLGPLNAERGGIYRVEAAVAEPSSLWLILTAVALIAAFSFSKTSIARY